MLATQSLGQINQIRSYLCPEFFHEAYVGLLLPQQKLFLLYVATYEVVELDFSWHPKLQSCFHLPNQQPT